MCKGKNYYVVTRQCELLEKYLYVRFYENDPGTILRRTDFSVRVKIAEQTLKPTTWRVKDPDKRGEGLIIFSE